MKINTFYKDAMSKINDGFYGALFRFVPNTDYKLVVDIEITKEELETLSDTDLTFKIFNKFKETLGKDAVNAESLIITNFYLIENNGVKIRLYNKFDYYNAQKLDNIWKQLAEVNHEI